MPSIDVAMARSIRPSALELLRDAVARGITAGLTQRDVATDASQKITDIKTALSSWDNCMAVAWCKWPLIGIIVVGGLIIFSIVWCIIRCCCCGLSCCCNCCQCLKCCGDCCGCCDPPGDRKHKHLDDPYAPATGHDAYRSEPPMNPTFGQTSAPQTSGTQFAPQTQHWQNEPPKYAELEVRGGKHDEDALPEMPTMEKAEVTTKVGLHDDVELDQLKKSPVQEQQYGMMNGTPSAMPQGRSPVYGQQQGNNSGYFNPGQAPDMYSPIDNKGYGYHNQGDGYDHDQYGTGVGAAPMDRHSPVNNYNGFNQTADRGYEQPHNGYGEYDNANQGYGTRQAPPAPSRTPAPELNGYGYGVAPSRSPAPQAAFDDYLHSARKTPAIQDSYGYQSEQAYGNHRTYSPAPEPHYGPRPVPQRQYPQQDPPRSPVNDAYNSGFARQDQPPATESYPGYKAYQP
ncbi:hypothetical protein B0T10DRAFT_106297 [Thelonectria olida]|uniref:Fibroin-3 n=1 Tax=Thelonectria olida TaxID=1576542 RepID=A0A9P9AW60_9HYPO|nr:hypothetical protein B0T10DRAFT_106297 [Thelonectria olida]